MANLSGVLGTMLATGMAGRSRRGAAFARSPFGGMGRTGHGAQGFFPGSRVPGGLGVAALGYLAYKAYQEFQKSQASRVPESPGRADAGAGAGSAPTSAGPSLGDRLSQVLRPEGSSQAAPAEPEPTIEDQRALLLIRAMIAAANADGEISPEERRTILAKLDQAGAGPEEHRVIEAELASPKSLDHVLREVKDEETAQQVYLASVLAIEPDSEAERTYLQYLATRLKLDPGQAKALQDAAG